MKYYNNILIIFFLFIVLNIQGQQILSPNFVQNPSFEQYDTCPNSSGQLNLSKHWWGASTEYYNACSTSGDFSVPSNYNGFQYAHTSVAYAGFYYMDIPHQCRIMILILKQLKIYLMTV